MTEQERQQIARIDVLSALARTSWLALLAYLAYVGITLLAVEDADFFVPSRQTQLPLVGIAIPTFSFFWFAPPLAAALYIYLHIHLLKLWDVLAAAPARIDGEALGDLIHPWLANDLFLTLRGSGTVSSRPLRRLSNLASRTLVWGAGPLVLVGFWWRSMPAHEEWLTLFLALCLAVGLYAGFSSWWGAVSAARRSFRRPWPNPWASWWKGLLGGLMIAFIVATGWLRTEWDLSLDKDTPGIGRWLEDTKLATLVPASLAGVEMVPLPAEWRTSDTARHAFRQIWCGREGLAMPVCGHATDTERPPSVHLAAGRRAWCEGHGLPDDRDCDAHFADLDRRFAAAWSEERDAGKNNLPTLDLAGRDLRRASASGISLVGANLRQARLERADLQGARLEGADLTEARLEGANLLGARLQGADLWQARLERANLGQARLEGAYLLDARLERADLEWAWLEGAYLRGARLEGAQLWGARLSGADLEEARLDGVDLREADLSSSNWTGASARTSLAHFADFRSALALMQSQLEGSVGNGDTLLPDTLAHDTGRPYYIWSCWARPPEGFDALVARVASRTYDAPERIRAELLCSAGGAPRKTGTPCPLDTPRHECRSWALVRGLVAPDPDLPESR